MLFQMKIWVNEALENDFKMNDVKEKEQYFLFYLVVYKCIFFILSSFNEKNLENDLKIL